MGIGKAHVVDTREDEKEDDNERKVHICYGRTSLIGMEFVRMLLLT